MSVVEEIAKMWRHAAWADRTLLDALAGVPELPPAALREVAHVFGAAETWLARIEGRAPRCAIWPALTLDECSSLAAQLRDAYPRLLDALHDDARLGDDVAYTNSAGQAFTTALGDILLQVVLHGQYHRGKVNLLLREHGLQPVTLDFIAFVRAGASAPRA